MRTVIFIVLFVTLASLANGETLFKLFSQGTPLYRGRADPIVNPGVFSGHSHRVFGASAFSMGKTGQSSTDLHDEMAASTCTTMSVTVDKSAYWIPDLYYQWPNGSFSLVPNGGLTIYYFGRGGSGNQSNPTFTAFPKGFRMLANSPHRRRDTGSIADKGISYACIGDTPQEETNYFPTDKLKCTNGLRAQVFFPMCWDGINLDSPNHMDHVAYPIERPNGGNCPATHPKRIPGIFYEVLYSVDQNKFPHGNGVQPFVWANGDPTGYGLHGDFLNGWDVDILQKAMEDPSCLSTNTNNGNKPENCLPLTPYVKKTNPDGSCVLDKPILNYEDIGLNHWIDHLPGNNPVVRGPENAVPQSGTWPQTIAPYVKRVLLKSLKTGSFVSSYAASSDSYLVADTAQSSLSYYQVFNFIQLGANKYGIATESTTHWVGNNNGGNPLTGDKNAPSDWEFWNLVYENGATGPTKDGVVCSILALGNNKYVTVNAQGQLVANAATVTGDTEKFLIIDANAGVPDTRPPGSVTPTSPSSVDSPSSASSLSFVASLFVVLFFVALV